MLFAIVKSYDQRPAEPEMVYETSTVFARTKVGSLRIAPTRNEAATNAAAHFDFIDCHPSQETAAWHGGERV
jgi:hypothetical protein